MHTHGKNFREWMDSNNITKPEACKRFGITLQTLYNWRSAGVPESKQPHVNYIISCWEKPTAAELGSTLLLKPSASQFRAWNQASLDEGQLLEQWAIAGLDQYAGVLGVESTLKVAEDEPDLSNYGKKDNGAK